MSFTTQDKEARKFETDPADSSKVVVKTKVENTSSDPIPVVISNADSAVDIQVEVGPAVTIDDSTPIDVNVTTNPVNTNATIQGTANVNVTNGSLATNATIQNSNIDVNLTDLNSDNRLPVSVDNTPTVNVSGTVTTNFTNTNIQAYSYVHNGSGFVFEAADVNGKTINLNHTYYTSTEITALGSSTDINLWLSAFNDGMLQLKFVESYNDEHEETVYYQHPSLGNGTKCLKLIFQYSTENSQTVVKSIFASVADWSFTDDIQGSVSISAGTVTSPDPNSTVAMHTVVTTLTITDNTLGAVTLSLSGTDASHYHLHEVETGTHSQSTLAVVTSRTYQVHAHSGFPTGSSYTHSFTVTVTGDIFGVSDSVNISTAGTMTTTSSWSNSKYVIGPAYYGTTSSSVYGVYTETNNGGFLSTTANTQDYASSAMTINFWAYVPSTTKTSSSTLGLICDMYGYHARVIEVHARDSHILLTSTYATGYASSRASIVRNQWNMYTVVLDSNTISACDMYIQTSSTFDNTKKNTTNYGTGSTWNASGNAIGVSTVLSPFGYNNYPYPTPSTASNWDNVTAVRLDEITVWNKALSLTEIEELSNNHTVMDPTTHSAYTSDNTVLKRYVRFGDGDNDVENSVQCDVDSSFVMNKESTFITDTRIVSY